MRIVKAPLPVTSVISGAFAYTDATCEKYFDENPVTKITFSGSNLKTIGRTDVASLTGEVGSALERNMSFTAPGISTLLIFPII